MMGGGLFALAPMLLRSKGGIVILLLLKVLMYGNQMSAIFTHCIFANCFNG